jgi:hypothetical protein
MGDTIFIISRGPDWPPYEEVKTPYRTLRVMPFDFDGRVWLDEMKANAKETRYREIPWEIREHPDVFSNRDIWEYAAGHAVFSSSPFVGTELKVYMPFHGQADSAIAVFTTASGGYYRRHSGAVTIVGSLGLGVAEEADKGQRIRKLTRGVLDQAAYQLTLMWQEQQNRVYGKTDLRKIDAKISLPRWMYGRVHDWFPK